MLCRPCFLVLILRKGAIFESYLCFILAVLAGLPKELTDARRVKMQGLAASALFLGSALLLLPLLPEKAPPALPDGSFELLALGGGGLAAAAAVTRALLGDKLFVEFHNGALYLQFDPPKEGGPCLTEGAAEVRSPLKSLQRQLLFVLLSAWFSCPRA